MAMMNRSQYLASLDDGRRIFAEGQEVKDLASHPQFATAIKLVGDGYEAHYRPGEDASGPYFKIPRSRQELKEILEDLLTWDMVTVTTSQGLLALLTAAARIRPARPEYARRIEEYFEYCRAKDLRCVQAITDAKGDRRLPPSKQHDPDVYTRIIERRQDGIVVRGAKLHISSAAVSHELIVMPTKNMKEGEEDYAVACAIPVNAPGVRIVNTSYAPRERIEDFPVSSQHNMPEGFVILDDVFVPNERVFLAGEIEHSATFAHALGLWERLGGTAHLAEFGDQLVGLAQLVAEANGTDRIHHIREKIAEMIIYATLVRAGLEAAIANAEPSPEGWYFPSELYTNAAKHYAAAEYSRMVRHLHDIGGGAIVTAPSVRDLENEEVGPFIRKYMATKEDIDGEYRTRLFHAVRDFTADAYGGWQLVTMIQSGGGLYAQRLVARKHYDMERAKDLARKLAGLA
ncbi:4-hydroxyphenylacetate 3-hydroxylase N-terminal domain-containing protein [Thermomonospora curvata]|uniref:Vinylacetyl-CoA Delta-isomerase n=1 Tax=Thermomonospora curvata (strain ATCC 19995 / DSM 43183 / JCM 3096 / KCTC 9072 / NBRC 15933 / NCIMB 10081 / Henssen B9) TaxID=471852 RepID=D1A7F2_THECD|nr:4-hydroxyphenylacetate 3-hydroxylase N-terminal domain-containing protein [Thermomonospora curvata]ACY96541.1 Vinylacetyl-CoA Delta-isomerase [Thermomonospora curvata DSM 43183]